MNNRDEFKYYSFVSKSLKEQHKLELMNIANKYYKTNEKVSWYALFELYGDFELEQFSLEKHNATIKS